MKTILIISILFLTLTLTPSPSHAGSHGWMIYYEGSFRGKVIDVETKKPIEGAVVVAVYHIRLFGPILPIFAGTEVADVQEVITDSKGDFFIPSNIFFYPWPTTFGGEYTGFIIFKPGYASYSGSNDCLSGGVCKEAEFPWLYNQQLKFKIGSGLVELPKLKTREERLDSLRSANLHGEVPWKKIKNLMHSINEEYKKLGITPYEEED